MGHGSARSDGAGYRNAHTKDTNGKAQTQRTTRDLNPSRDLDVSSEFRGVLWAFSSSPAATPSSLTLRPSVMLLGGPCRGRYPALFRIASPSKARLRPQLMCPAQLCLPSACLLFQSSPWSLIQRPLAALPCSRLQSLPRLNPEVIRARTLAASLYQ